MQTWDLASGDLIATLPSAVPPFLVSDQGTVAAAEGSPNTVGIWDSSGSQVATLRPPPGNVTAAGISGDGTTVAMADGSAIAVDNRSTVYVYSLPRRALAGAVPIPEDGSFLAISSHGSLLALARGDQVILVSATSQTVTRLSSKGPVSAAFSPDGKELAVSEDNGTVGIWVLQG